MSEWIVDEDTPIALALEEMAKDISEKCRKSGVNIESEVDVKHLYLAHVFFSVVAGSGFPGLLREMQGNYLRDIEDLLLRVEAKRAHQAYTEAIKMCFSNVPQYQEMLTGQRNQLADSLQLHSVEYLRGRQLIDESEVALRVLIRSGREWLAV